jgi:cytochrome c oxidase subunit III
MKKNQMALNMDDQIFRVHPKKFITWLFIVSIVMLFAALTSAYLVRRSEGNWLDITLPPVMWISTLVIVASSISLHLAYLAGKKNNFQALNSFMALTVVLGISFIVTQYLSWQELVSQYVYFAGKYSNPAGSFLYVLTGLHGFHIISGIIFLIVVLINSLRLKIHSKSLTQIVVCATYWHFLGALWIYLFVFLLYNR